MVRREKFEFSTDGLEVHCSVQLSYRRIKLMADLWNFEIQLKGLEASVLPLHYKSIIFLLHIYYDK